MATSLASRKINQETVIDPRVEYTRVWSFRTQEQMDLWINEMQGQISDGAWENSNGTDWLWKGHDVYSLNPEKPTSLTYIGSWGWQRRRTTFGMSKAGLVDYIEERVYTQNGFEYGDFKALKSAWSEIQEAIKNAKEEGYGSILYKKLVEKPRAYSKALKEAKTQEILDYIKNNLSDILEREEQYQNIIAFKSHVKGLYFDLQYNKVKVHDYNKNSLLVEKEQVRATVDFLKNTLGVGAK